jgi:hypothetical protein
MKNIVSFTLLLCVLIACGDRASENMDESLSEVNVDWKNWKISRGGTYPFREEMYLQVLYSDSLRTLTKSQVLNLLGKPDRTHENFIYYLVDETNLGFWTLNSKSLVFKFTATDSVEWIKLHE